MDRDSFDRAMMDHLPAAHRLAVRLVGEPDRAEELVQEAMLRASRSWQSFRGHSRFTTWLFQIVINVFRDQLRRRQGVAREEVPDDLADDRMHTPQQRVSGAELGELIARHVSNLPPRQREVLVLVAYEQMTPAQAAAVLGISETNARTNLHHARSTLKRLLAMYLEDDSKGHCEDRKRSTI